MGHVNAFVDEAVEVNSATRIIVGERRDYHCLLQATRPGKSHSLGSVELMMGQAGYHSGEGEGYRLASQGREKERATV